MRIGRGLYVHHAVTAAIVRVGISRPCLDSMTIQFDNGLVTPGGIARFSGVIVPIGPMSARPCRDIDAGTTAQDLSHLVWDRPSVQARVRFGDKTPIQFTTERHRP